MKNLFPSLPDTPNLSDALKAFPQAAGTIMGLIDEIMLRDSDLSVAERELIAAYVSSLNACTFCYGSHKIAAEAFGIDDTLIEAMVSDPKTAPIPAKLKPIVAYVTCLTQSPSKLTETHANDVYSQGWSEQALYDAIQVCALFNFMNRLVDGTGVTFDPTSLPAMTESEKADRRKRTYSDFAKSIGIT